MERNTQKNAWDKRIDRYNYEAIGKKKQFKKWYKTLNNASEEDAIRMLKPE